MKKDEITLSIYVPTYNHEKYIEQALDSIRMQKTQYLYEVLVGEDCSSDNTKAILQNYEKLYPGFVKVFYREHNMHKEEINNAADLKRRCKGKYIIALEGDDYWTDPYKIEKQIMFLEKHPEYLAVSHHCYVVNGDSQQMEERYCECEETEYTLQQYIRGILPGQLTTVMMRNYYKEEIFDTSFIQCNIEPGDKRIYFTLACNGKIYCMQEKMSAYRHITDKGSSYSANVKHNFERQKNWYLAQLEYAYKIQSTEGIRCAEYLYIKEILSGIKNKDISIRQALICMKLIKNKVNSLAMLMKYK